jgi:uncharacterized protein
VLPADLHQARYVNLETFKRDGEGVKTPVWFAEVDGRIGVYTDKTSYKVKRLRRNSRVRVAACTVSGAVRGPWHEGVGELVTDPGLEQAIYRALIKKYGWQMRLAGLASRVSGRVGRRTTLALDLREGRGGG